MTVMEFWTSYLWPLIVIVAQSLLLLVLLLVSIAYVLLADRKIWAAVQMRRGPNVVGPWGLLQSFADLLKFVFKERPQLARIGQIVASGPADIRQLSAMKGDVDKAPFRSVIDDYYLTNPIARASAVMAECSALAEGRGAMTAAE